MPAILDSVAVSDDLRRANDRSNRPIVVVAVLLVLGLYAYLLTSAAEHLGIGPAHQLAERVGVSSLLRFDDNGSLWSSIDVGFAATFARSDDELLAFLLIVAAAFLSAYLLPLQFKQGALVVWTGLAMWLLYGGFATAGLLFAHLAAYLVLHPHRDENLPVSAAAGVAGYLAFAAGGGGALRELTSMAGCGAGCALVYRYGILPALSRPRLAAALRFAVVQSAVIAVAAGVLVAAAGGDFWAYPVGLLLFFWQWAKLTMYHIDHRDGLVPNNIPLSEYLAVFWSPGLVPNWTWDGTIAQGYSYTKNNFLCEDKNRLVLGGVKLLVIALVYLWLWDWGRRAAVDFFSGLGIPVYQASTRALVRGFTRGEEVGTASVLITTLLDLVRWMLLFGSVVHFKVGIWRICGYRIAPYYHRPWTATNLVVLWPRFAFHFREFLIRGFYYPVFFRFFRKRPQLRVLAATMAAAAGNLLFHVVQRLYAKEASPENVWHVVGMWPYFVLLGAGIGLTQIWLMRKKRTRRAWTLDRRVFNDIACAYATVQFFALIHIFARPVPASSVADLWRLFLIGFGIHLPR